MITLELSLDREGLLAVHNFMHGSLSAWMGIEEGLSIALTDALSSVLKAHPIGAWIQPGMEFFDPHGHKWRCVTAGLAGGEFVAENAAGGQSIFRIIGEEKL